MRWLALVVLVTACKKDAAPQPVATGSGSATEIAPPPSVAPTFGPIADIAAFCADSIKAAGDAHAPECTLADEHPVNVGPWQSAAVLRFATDAIGGELIIRPALRTQAGWWLVGARHDCGTFSEAGPCKLGVVDVHVANDAIDLRYRVSRTRDTDHVLHCTNGDTVTCAYAH